MIDYKSVKLIVSDMDGTLLHSDYTLNEEFFSLYEQLKELDIKFAVASGRQYESLLHIFDSIKDEIYFIAENGGNVMYKNQSVLVQALGTDIIKKTIEISKTLQNTSVLLCGLKYAYAEKSNTEFVDHIVQYYPRNKAVSDLLDPIDDEIVKIALYNLNGTEKNTYPSFRHLEDDYTVLVSGQHWLDISVKNSNKGIALQKVQNILNISEEETMSFGDYLNDLGLMHHSHYSYAMENAHPQVKEAARFRADTNNNDGVLKVLREVVRQNKNNIA